MNEQQIKEYKLKLTFAESTLNFISKTGHYVFHKDKYSERFITVIHVTIEAALEHYCSHLKSELHKLESNTG